METTASPFIVLKPGFDEKCGAPLSMVPGELQVSMGFALMQAIYKALTTDLRQH